MAALFGTAAGLLGASLHGPRTEFFANLAAIADLDPSPDEKILATVPLEAPSSTPPTIREAQPAPSKPKAAPKAKKTADAVPAKAILEKHTATSSAERPTSTPWCAWKTFGKPRGDIWLNEIAWMGAEDESDAEWIELKNVAGAEIDLKNWRLQSKSGKVHINLQAALTAGALYIVGSAPEEADWNADLSENLELSNSGEWLKLFNSSCGLVDEVDARKGWPGGSNTSKKTLERKVASDLWQTSGEVGGSPGKQNTIILNLPPAANSSSAPPEENISSPPKILIVAIQTSGGAGKSENDQIRIFNAGSEAADVGGWKLRKKTKSGAESSIKTFPDGTVIAGGGYLLWANSKFPEGAAATSTATIADDNSVALLNKEDVIEDAVAWGTDHESPYKEGNAYPSNLLPAQILTRIFENDAYRDSGDNGRDFEVK